VPLLSIIVVTYNAEAVVSRTLESIAAQTGRDYECVLVDGASKDDTVAVAHRYAKRLAGLELSSEPDESLYDAMNKGLEKAQGDYVLYLNAGDVFHDDRVVEDFSVLISGEREPPAMVYGHTAVVMHDGKQFLRRVRSLDYIRHGQPTVHQSVFFRRDAHLRAPYRYRDYSISADYASMALLQKRHSGRILRWDRIVADFHNDPGSVTNRHLWLRTRDAWQIQKNIIGVPLPRRLASAFRRVAAHLFYNARLPSRKT